MRLAWLVMSAGGKMPILIVTGPPGVDKTTVAGMFAERSARAVHLEADAFFRFIRSGYVEPWRPESHEQNSLVMRIVAAAAAGYAAAGYFTIVDGIVIPGWFLEPLRGALRGEGHRVAYAVLRAPLATCTARARSRGDDPLADPEVIERLWRDFADLGSLERNAVELGSRGPQEAAALLEQRLADGSLEI
jgi:tRNA uridine 5-carbamoylmethylation protein Kti12